MQDGGWCCFCFVTDVFFVNSVIEVLINFYTADELSKAKELFHGELSKLNLDGLPRLSKRQAQCEGCRRHHCACKSGRR